MSFFSNMFGGKKEHAMTTGEAIQNLRETEDILNKKQEVLEKRIDQELEVAKKNGTKNKRGTTTTDRILFNSEWCTRISRWSHSILAAIQALKRKKRYEKQLQQIDGTLSTIEMQRVALEEANTNTSVITTMKNAADALKNAHQHM